MTEKPDLGELSPGRFGEVVADVLADGWPGLLDVSPASPDGVVDAIVQTEGNRHLVHVGQDRRVDAPVVSDLALLTENCRFGSITLMTTGQFTKGARTAASEEGMLLVDGTAFSSMVEVAGVELGANEELTGATLAMRFAARWPEPLREHAVELGMVIDGVSEFDHQVTIGSERADVDFTPIGRPDVVSRMRFTETSLLVYVRRGARLVSVVRLSALRRDQPPFVEVADELAARVRTALDEFSDRRSRGRSDSE